MGLDRPAADATIRTYREGDLTALSALIDALSGPERVITERGLRSFLSVPGYRPESDLFVAVSADGTLLGVRDVRVTARGDEETLILESWGGVLADAGASVPTRLLEAVQQRASRLLAERERLQGILQARCAAADRVSRALFEGAGFHYARDLVSMLRRSLHDIAEPRLPAAIALRCYRPGEDDAAWVGVFNAAFADHWGGFMGMSPALWEHYRHEPIFNPELSLVACAGQEIVGFCHCRVDRELNALTGRNVGMIRYVGVVPAWRGKGLGAALTLAGLRALRDVGMEAVALGVDAENVTGAHLLYQRFGFEVTDRQVIYRRAVFATAAEL